MAQWRERMAGEPGNRDMAFVRAPAHVAPDMNGHKGVVRPLSVLLHVFDRCGLWRK